METVPTEGVAEPARTRRPVALEPTAARETVVLWSAALGTAVLGTSTIYMAMPGLNWGLWTWALAAGLVLFARRAGKPLTAAMLIPLGLACVISSGAAVTADEPWHALIVLVTAALIAVAMLFARGERSDRVGALWMASAPAVAAVRGVTEVLRRTGEVVGLIRGERSLPALHGVLIAIPVVGLFALLLSSADPVLAEWRDAVVSLLETLDWIPRVMFFSFLGTIALGGFGIALRSRAEPLDVAGRAPAIQLGVTERLILLGSVAGLFALFLGLQLSYLFGNAPSVAGSGVSFAEYARRGFGELSVVVTLCTLLILLTDRHAARGPREERVRIVQLLLVAELQVLLVSAFRRVLLYESAYGFTSARLYAQAYMVGVSLCLMMLAWEIWSSIDARRLARRSAVLAGSMFAVLTFWNHDAWIATQNVDRYASTGKIDLMYLARLSPNALPTLAASADRLAPEDVVWLRACLHQTYWGNAQWREKGRWFEWNLRRGQARRALASAGIDVAVKPPPTEPRTTAAPVCRYITG